MAVQSVVVVGKPHPEPLSETFRKEPRSFLPSSRRKDFEPLVVSKGGKVLCCSHITNCCS